MYETCQASPHRFFSALLIGSLSGASQRVMLGDKWGCRGGVSGGTLCTAPGGAGCTRRYHRQHRHRTSHDEWMPELHAGVQLAPNSATAALSFHLARCEASEKCTTFDMMETFLALQ